MSKAIFGKGDRKLFKDSIENNESQFPRNMLVSKENARKV
jgi:hypothetical protein